MSTVVNMSQASFLSFSFFAFINSVPISIFVMITKCVIFAREQFSTLSSVDIRLSWIQF